MRFAKTVRSPPLSRSLSPSLSHAHSFTHIHSLARSLHLSRAFSLSLSLPRSLSHAHSLTHSHKLALSLSLSRSPALSVSRSPALSLSLSPALSMLASTPSFAAVLSAPGHATQDWRGGYSNVNLSGDSGIQNSFLRRTAPRTHSWLQVRPNGSTCNTHTWNTCTWNTPPMAWCGPDPRSKRSGVLPPTKIL